MIDLAIVGAGPSAISAAIYAARDGLNVKVFEKQIIGGLVSQTDLIENYPGFEEGITGLDLIKKMRSQAEKFGAKFEYAEVSSLEQKDGYVTFLADGFELKARTILLAVGNEYRKLGIENEDRFIGRGIYFCGTCDGPLFKDKEVIAVGGGNSAVQEAIFISKYASKVHLIVRSDIKAQEVLKERLEDAVNKGKITVYKGAQIKELLMDAENISGAKITFNDSREDINILSPAIFEFIGWVPNTNWLDGSGVETNDRGEIIVDKNLKTSLDLVYATGDAIEDAKKQIIIAAGNGALAALNISKKLSF